MKNKRNLLFVLIILITFAVSTVILGYVSRIQTLEKNSAILQKNTKKSPTPTIHPEKKIFTKYEPPQIEKKEEYTIFLLGDSMTYALGPHGGIFNEKINKLFEGDRPGILIDNYSQSSTNVLSVMDAMNKQITNIDIKFEPMLSRKADIIMIESFGYNPLSQFPRDEGLKIQKRTLDNIMNILLDKYPNTAIIFVATISPNKAFYGTNIIDGSALDRMKQAEERIDFIKNHIEYAKSHNIPLVNIYEKSLTPDGDGNLEYINPDDYIHPSAVGIDFIGEEMANFIYESKILPE